MYNGWVSDVPAAPPTSEAQSRAWRAGAAPPVEKLSDRLWSVPVPMPGGLRYVLSYLLIGDDGLLVVDPGWPDEQSWQALSVGIAASGYQLADVGGIAVTHVHPDHGGLAGRLSEVSGAWIGAHPGENAMLEHARRMGGRSWASPEWARACAVPQETAGPLGPHTAVPTTGWFLPRVDRPLVDGARLPVRGVEIIARHTPGHTRGHLCFELPEFGRLMSGDHVLPRITPNIAAYQEGDEAALTEYLWSLDLVAGLRVTEVLPGHEYRFGDLAGRVAALREHHARRLAEIMRAVAGGAATVWAIAAQLSWTRPWSELSHSSALRAALGETKAHLHHAERTGRARRRVVDGTDIWTAGRARG
jgi:glyoxylase-like metal-dependent hydrolase (beta-lactamase superfamily II)